RCPHEDPRGRCARDRRSWFSAGALRVRWRSYVWLSLVDADRPARGLIARPMSGEEVAHLEGVGSSVIGVAVIENNVHALGFLGELQDQRQPILELAGVV